MNECSLALETVLRQWFPAPAFTKAAKIQSYAISQVEHQLIAQAVTSRQNEFTTGRWLARQGLQQLGLPVVPITIGKLKNPLWPQSIIGSISHDGQNCAVVLIPKLNTDAMGIGIDIIAIAQRQGKLAGLTSLITCDAKELAAVKSLQLTVEPTLLLFSIKESIIKALVFYLDDFIDMRDIEITLTNKLLFKIFGKQGEAQIFAAISANYLLTAVKIYRIEQ